MTSETVECFTDLSHAEALAIAMPYYNALKPFCDQIKIAGSLRRHKSEIHDIDIVCQPKMELQTDPEKTTLFDTVMKWFPVSGFVDYINSLNRILGSPFGRQVKVLLPEGIKLDIFITNQLNFGLILLIRTGSENYAKNIMYQLDKRGMQSVEGHLYYKNSDVIIPVPDEQTFFEVTGIPYLEPSKRNL